MPVSLLSLSVDPLGALSAEIRHSSSGVAMGKGSDGPPIGVGSGLSPVEEAKQVNQAKAKAGELKAGDVCFVLAAGWIAQWQTYCSESGAEKPEAIDNKPILLKTADIVKSTVEKEDDGYEPQLKPGLAEGDDYVLVSEFEWKLLFQWYVLYEFCCSLRVLCSSLNYGDRRVI